MKKKFLKITSFVLVFALTITATLSALNFKYLDSVFKFDSFYELPENTVDVLVLGSSHAYQGINTSVLWNEYGYSAFNLCGAAQPIWNTYFYLEEALKTQTPKVIILDIYSLHYTTEYSESSFAIKNTYGMKWSDTKKEAIEASFDTEKTGNQYFIELLQYHSRYSDLNKTDFFPYQANKEMYSNHKGFYCYFRSDPTIENDLTKVLYNNEITEKSMLYFKMTLELAESKGIPVIVTAIPFAAENHHQGVFNTAQEVVESNYNAAFINCLTDYKDAVGIDYTTDFADSQHLNHLGNTKLTRFFGDYLKANYDIPDNRNNSLYQSWDADATVYYNQLENHNNSLITNLGDYMPVLQSDRYTSIVTLSCVDFEKLSERNRLYANYLLKNIDSGFSGENGVWIIESGRVAYSKNNLQDGYSKAVSLGKTDGALIKSVDKMADEETILTVNELYYNKQKKSLTDNGINIIVYDNFTQSLIDVVCIDFNSGKFRR